MYFSSYRIYKTFCEGPTMEEFEQQLVTVGLEGKNKSIHAFFLRNIKIILYMFSITLNINIIKIFIVCKNNPWNALYAISHLNTCMSCCENITMILSMFLYVDTIINHIHVFQDVLKTSSRTDMGNTSCLDLWHFLSGKK